MAKSTVYFTKEITPESLVKIYQALQTELKGKVGVKISTGEPGGHNYLRPELIGQLVQMLNGTIIECCTAYGGQRQILPNTERPSKTMDSKPWRPVILWMNLEKWISRWKMDFI